MKKEETFSCCPRSRSKVFNCSFSFFPQRTVDGKIFTSAWKLNQARLSYHIEGYLFATAKEQCSVTSNNIGTRDRENLHSLVSDPGLRGEEVDVGLYGVVKSVRYTY